MFKASESIQTAPDLTVPAKNRRNADSDLVRWVATAVRSHGGARALRGYEREALEQEVALRILRATPRTGSARAVLAWIDRAERMPATAAREELRTRTALGAMTADERGRALWRTVTHALEARTWQEHSARYRTATDRQRNTGPMVQPSTGDSGTLLALSLESDSARLGTAANVGALAPLVDGPWSSVGAAIDLAYGQGWTTAQARNVAIALERARSVALADSGTSRASASDVIRSVAAHRGVSVNSVEAAAKRGVSLLGAVADAGEVLRAIRHSARMAQRGEHIALAAAAHSAVRAHALAGGSWDSESIHCERKMPAREDRVSGPVAPTRTAPTRARGVLAWIAHVERTATVERPVERVGEPFTLPAVATVQRRTSGAGITRVERKPGPCKCEMHKPCPVHRAPLVPRITAGQRDRLLPVLPMWPSVVSERVAAR